MLVEADKNAGGGQKTRDQNAGCSLPKGMDDMGHTEDKGVQLEPDA